MDFDGQFNDYIKRGAEELLERSTENIRYIHPPNFTVRTDVF